MKQFLLFFIFCLIISNLNAQYYVLPNWTEDLPYSSNGNSIFAIGISDPRMTDTILAEEIAIHRAICMAILFRETTILYTSNYFEKKDEDYRWFILQEDIEELGKFTAQGFVTDSSYKIINKHINKNGETIVLLKYSPTNNELNNFFVNGEYYKQDFELSNTRAHEYIRSIHFDSKWINNETKDSLSTKFRMTNYNGSISSEIYYNDIELSPPGYYYHYQNTLPNIVELADYNTSVKLLKGLWIAYLDSYIQSIIKISKNHSSKMKTLQDSHIVNRNDGISEKSQESMARSISKNTLSFEYGGIEIYKNQLFPRIYLKGERKVFKLNQKESKNDTISVSSNKEKKKWLKRLFKKK